MRFRENSEGVALYHGEEDELRRLPFPFRFGGGQLVGDHEAAETDLFTVGYSQAAVVFPFVVGAPRYFSGAIQLGGLVQISNAFGQVQGALSWFIGAYTDFASWKATVDRLTGFHKAIFLTQEENRAGMGPAVVADASIDDLELRNLDLALPTGRTLVSGINARIEPGERVLIKGPSGSGKSTLFAPLPGSGPSAGGKSGSPAISTPSSCRSALTFPSVPCAR